MDKFLVVIVRSGINPVDQQGNDSGKVLWWRSRLAHPVLYCCRSNGVYSGTELQIFQGKTVALLFKLTSHRLAQNAFAEMQGLADKGKSSIADHSPACSQIINKALTGKRQDSNMALLLWFRHVGVYPEKVS